ncbi:hypothetical protein C8F01DRAFT_1156449, partial [Mycena amicta]
MELVTPETAAQRAGWKVTEMGRVLRPMRMRPERPLPPPLATETKPKKKEAATSKPKRRRDPTLVLADRLSMGCSWRTLQRCRTRGYRTKRVQWKKSESSSDEEPPAPSITTPASTSKPTAPPPPARSKPPLPKPPSFEYICGNRSCGREDRRAPSKATKLKDLFAPRAEDPSAGFSLLGHLDLDLELDEHEFAHLTAPNAPNSQPTHVFVPTHTHAPITLDPKQPLFFPLPATTSHDLKARQRDILDVAKDAGWAAHFCKTETERRFGQVGSREVELTRDWTKMQRRRK